MNNDLQLTARRIRLALERHVPAIPLDRPDTLADTPPPAGQTGRQSVPPVPLRPPEPPSSPQPIEQQPSPPSQKPQLLEPEQDPGEEHTTVAGFKPEELLTAPIAPPQPVKTEKASATRNNSVLFLTAIGVLLAVVGVFMMFVSIPALGFIIMLLGAILIAAGVFVPFKK